MIDQRREKLSKYIVLKRLLPIKLYISVQTTLLNNSTKSDSMSMVNSNNKFSYNKIHLNV